MRLVKPKAEPLAIYGLDTLPYSYDKTAKMIEVVGRTCYKSEEKITEDSYKKFIEMLCERGHHAMLEHSWQVRRYYNTRINEFPSPFLYCVKSKSDSIVAGNLRAFVEAEIEGFLPIKAFKTTYDLCYPPYILQKAIEFGLPQMIAMTAKFICDRGVTHELVRNRASFGQESTRWCNYGGEVSFIIPPWFSELEEQTFSWDQLDKSNLTPPLKRWIQNRLKNEDDYKDMLNMGFKAEQARGELPNCLKTEIIVTASIRHWQLICAQREKGMTGKPHPQMVEVMGQLFEKVRPLVPFFNKDYMEDIQEEIKQKGKGLKEYFKYRYFCG